MEVDDKALAMQRYVADSAETEDLLDSVWSVVARFTPDMPIVTAVDNHVVVWQSHTPLIYTAFGINILFLLCVIAVRVFNVTIGSIFPSCTCKSKKAAFPNVDIDATDVSVSSPAPVPASLRSRVELHDLMSRVTILDQAQPSVWIRVEGYLNEKAYEAAKRSHGRIMRNTTHFGYDSAGKWRNLSAPTEPFYGFSHYIPVEVSACRNASCDASALAKFYKLYMQGTDNDIVYQYSYDLSHSDKVWLSTVQTTLQHAYLHHEGCQCIRTDVVYTLDGVTPAAAPMTASPYDSRGVFSRYLRSGMNAELYDWGMATVGGTGKRIWGTDVSVRKKGEESVCYLFQHTKMLRLSQELVPIPPQKPYK
jgi:hypothetical protein